MNPVLPTKSYAFLEGAGEMGQLIAEYDWRHSPLGSIQQWSPALRVTLGNLLHSAFPMFLFWGEELTCFYNDAFRPSLGIDGKHPAIGKKGQDVWEEIWSFIHPLIQQVLVTGQPVWFRDQLVPFYRNGKIEQIYWTFSYSPAYDMNGGICGVLVTCMETTETVVSRRDIEKLVEQRTQELKEAHTSLLKANGYLQTIINLFKEPLQVLEPVMEDGEIVDFIFKLTNQAYASYAGSTPEELKGKRVGDIFPGYFQTMSFTRPVETYKTGCAATFDLHYDQDGMDLYNRMSAAKQDGEVMVHFTDFTELKRLQLELMQKIEELERSNRQLEEFAHAASHDLKEPIRKIQIFVSQLKEQIRDRISTGELLMLEKTQRSAQRMGMLVNDLLFYSQLNQEQPQKEEIDLNDLIKQVLEDLEISILQTKATVRYGDLPLIKGYRRQLQQALQNLIGNAIKYSKPGEPPVIIISAGEGGEGKSQYQFIEIADNGIGFPQEFADKIFQMFTRLHNKESYEGTGIGLSIVKKIIENHGGTIRVHSEARVGSTFRIELPS